MLLALRGTPFLYYGDEIGMPEVEIDPADGAGPRAAPHGQPGAQPRRLPHADAVERRAGRRASPTPGVEPWLPLGDAAAHNVADQRADAGSTLHLVRDLIALRRERADLRGGGYETLPAPDGRVGVAARRGPPPRRSTCPAARSAVDGLGGTVLVATDRARDGEPVDGALRLGPWEGAVVALA